MSAIAITPHTRYAQQAPAAERRRPSTVRLTRRGRLVVLLSGLFLALVVGVAVGAASVASGESQQTETVVVGSGETLWSIADEAAGDGSTSEMIHEIEQLNELESGLVYAGQSLEIPVG